ncbi:MAG: dihydrolipoamide dehydrogenase [Thermosediminibacterales bacterium]|nr:dihydrolipoamide dehydrogenase [Thermosediminibacterales bacterium]MDK2836106.1 dihydrolipoamide dehydrogenase [Thermosediminibacterales bacterium]
MDYQIKMPKLSDSMTKATIVKWLKKEGEIVNAGEIIVEVTSGKVNNEIESEVSGTLKQILKSNGEEASVDTPIAVIDCSEEELRKVVSESQSINDDVGSSYFGSLLKKKKEKKDADICVIGAGPGGYVAAIRAAQSGAKVVIIEKDKLGGTCLNRGCIPTKALVRSAEILDNVEKAEEFGISVEKFELDYSKVVKRKDNVVSTLVGGIEHLLRKNGVEIIEGTAQIKNMNTVFVESLRVDTEINAKNIIIATGSIPAKLPIEGIDSKNVMNSDSILDTKNLPKSIVIIGGGVIGMEFAFILRKFGVEVSVVELMENVLPNIDEEASVLIRKAAEAKGIKIFTGVKVEKIQDVENGGSIVVTNHKGTIKNIYGEKVFVSVGRQFNTENLGLEEVGIEMNRKAIKVNEYLQTTVPNIYAVGDVIGGIMLAHVASEEGITAVENIIYGNKQKVDYNVIPSAIFTDPEIAVIGLSEKQAEEKGYDIKIGRFPYAANGKALTLGKNEGFVKIIADEKKNIILGACIVGVHATDLIHEIAVAMKNKLTIEQLAMTVHAHPTTAETVMEASLDVLGKAIHF